MHSRPVFRVAQALADAGIAALRFNFRGVGGSTGAFDNGVGEMDDARAAIEWVAARYPGLPLVVGGFSFGAAIGLSAGAEHPRVVALIGAGVPVDRLGYDFTAAIGALKPILVVQGSEDEFGSPGRVARHFARLGPLLTLDTIHGADHLFTGRTAELMASVTRYLRSPIALGLFPATNRIE